MSTGNISTSPNTGNSVTSRKMGTVWRWITVVFAMAILFQAVFASVGLFENEPRLVDIHRELGNTLPLLALVQAVLAFLLFRRGAVGKAELWIGIALVPVVMVQLSMGYETSDSSTALAIHIPFGVLLMGLTTVNAALGWIPRARD